MTLRELIIKINGHIKRRETDFQQEKWLIWQHASLMRYKRLPKFKTFLRGNTEARKIEGQEAEERRKHHSDVAEAYQQIMLRKKGKKVNVQKVGEV